eukprot:5493364-Lingulodinium_polyedra.AAC.1
MLLSKAWLIARRLGIIEAAAMEAAPSKVPLPPKVEFAEPPSAQEKCKELQQALAASGHHLFAS